MVEVVSPAARRSPFEGHAPTARPNAAGDMGVRLHAAVLRSVTQASTWISGVSELERALASALGQPVPARTGQIQQSDHGLLVRTGPEEFLLIAEQALDNTALLRRHVTAQVGAVTDLSHARCRIRIAGDRCRDTLSKLFPLDLRDAAFPLAQIRLTGHHHVPALMHRIGRDQFDLYVLTTYARDQLHALVDAALEYGLVVES